MSKLTLTKLKNKILPKQREGGVMALYAWDTYTARTTAHEGYNNRTSGQAWGTRGYRCHHEMLDQQDVSALGICC